MSAATWFPGTGFLEDEPNTILCRVCERESYPADIEGYYDEDTERWICLDDTRYGLFYDGQDDEPVRDEHGRDLTPGRDLHTYLEDWYR